MKILEGVEISCKLLGGFGESLSLSGGFQSGKIRRKTQTVIQRRGESQKLYAPTHKYADDQELFLSINKFADGRMLE